MPHDAAHAIPYVREIIVFLLVAVVVVPLAGRLKLSPILGFLVAGIFIGPYGFGVINDVDGVRRLAELGIVFLLFKVGLELSFDRLMQLRSLVFGLGAAQVMVSGLAITAIAYFWGNSIEAALVIGFALALSSTAIVMRLLIERNAIGSHHGRASFSVLLFQDLAVVPILLFVSILGGDGGGSITVSVLSALGRAVLAIAVIAFIGRFILSRLFRTIAAARSPEVFMALTLLTVLATALGTAAAGLSMALGAFLAGLMLAGTEFRHQVEADIAPFEGLLLGLFFISVGMGMNFQIIGPILPLLAVSVAGLMVLKAVIAGGLALAFRQRLSSAVQIGMLLSQSGEFAFVIMASAMALGLLVPETAQFMTVLTAITMMLSPALPMVSERVGHWLERRDAEKAQDLDDVTDLSGHVVIAGYGRVGQTVAKVLAAEKIPHVAIDADSRLVGSCRAAGDNVFFGDGTRADILGRLGIANAGVVLITLNDTQAAGRALSEIRRHWARVPVFVRARDAAHQQELQRLGATHLVPETLEASLQLSGRVLEAMGTPLEAVNAIIDQFRENEYADLADIIEPDDRDEPKNDPPAQT